MIFAHSMQKADHEYDCDFFDLEAHYATVGSPGGCCRNNSAGTRDSSSCCRALDCLSTLSLHNYLYYTNPISIAGSGPTLRTPTRLVSKSHRSCC